MQFEQTRNNVQDQKIIRIRKRGTISAEFSKIEKNLNETYLNWLIVGWWVQQQKKIHEKRIKNKKTGYYIV